MALYHVGIIWTLPTFTCLNKMKHDVGGRGLLLVLQVIVRKAPI